MALGWILFGKGDRHVTAEMLYEEATHAKVPVSLATVYNTLHQFTEVGLLAPGRGRRLEDLFRHQQFRAPPLLHRGRERSHGHPRRPTCSSARRRRRPRATRSPASTSWCGCGARAEYPSCAAIVSIPRHFTSDFHFRFPPRTRRRFCSHCSHALPSLHRQYSGRSAHPAAARHGYAECGARLAGLRSYMTAARWRRALRTKPSMVAAAVEFIDRNG